MILRKKNKIWDKKCQKINTYIGGRKCNEVWNFIKKVKCNKRVRTNITVIENKKWVKHYKELLTEDRTEYMIHEKDTPIKIEGEEIIIEVETIKSCSKTKKWKSCRTVRYSHRTN